MPYDSGYDKRIRKEGGGRKGYEENVPNIDEKFLDVLMNYTAGNPMNKDIVWTNLTQQEIADRLCEKHNVSVSTTVIAKLLKKHNSSVLKYLLVHSGRTFTILYWIYQQADSQLKY